MIQYSKRSVRDHKLFFSERSLRTLQLKKVGSEVPRLLNPLASMINKANIRMKSDQIEASKVCRMCKS